MTRPPTLHVGRGRPPSRLRLLIPVAGLVSLVLAAAVAFGSGGQAPLSAHPGALPPAKRTDLRPAPPHRRRHRHRPSSSQEARAVRRVLRYAPVVAAGGKRRRLMALTFDDGPSPYTAGIVAILARMHAPATFFVVGQQLRYFSSGLHDELRHGFVIGDHTENHAWLSRLSGPLQYGQISDAAARAEQLGSPRPLLFRPPYGIYDQSTLAQAHRLGMLTVLWSLDTADWRRPGAAVILRRVLRRARPGAIVLMHDGGGDRSQTTAALPEMIAGLRRRGYRLVSVPALLALDPPGRHQRLPPMIGA